MKEVNLANKPYGVSEKSFVLPPKRVCENYLCATCQFEAWSKANIQELQTSCIRV